MKVDILLATYNGATYLAQQLDSIAAQDFTDWQLIVRDDLSTDITPVLLEEFARRHPGRVTLLPSEKRLGAVGNFGALLMASTAEYVMCCDQDDVWLPDKISLTLSTMQALEEKYGRGVPLLVHTDAEVVDASLTRLHASHAALHALDPAFSPLNRLLMQNTVQGCTMMMNRALLTRALPIPVEARMHDMWLALAAAAFGHIAYVPQATMQYRQHAGNEVGVGKKTVERLRSVKQGMNENAAQAAALLSRFGGEMDAQTKQAVSALATLQQHGFIAKRYILLRYGLLRRPLWQNLAVLLFA